MGYLGRPLWALSASRHRSKSVPHPTTVYCGKQELKYLSSWLPFGTYTYSNSTFGGRQYRYKAESWDSLHPGPPYRTGGPLLLTKLWDPSLDLSNTGVYYNPSGGLRYTGGFLCNSSALLFGTNVYDFGTSSAWDEWGDPSSYGAMGWNRYRPAQPGADLGTFIGEAKDLPRQFRDTARHFRDIARSARKFGSGNFTPGRMGGDWLNVQFGWLPFLNDFRKFYKTWRNLDKMLKQIIRDNGRWVRRGGVVDVVEDQEVLSTSADTTMHWPILSTSFYSSPSHTGRHDIVQKTISKAWFSAKFRYYIPPLKVDDVVWQRNAVRRLFGGTISPGVLWEITPWSWLVDWFSNVGDVFANMDSGLAENLAAKYAYVMRHTRSVITVDSTHDLVGNSLDATWEFSLDKKARAVANPFGFGLTWDDLSTRQWSIMGALGLSRLRL